ncbi:MAG: 30S ribosomal protein S13 [Halobacteriales archaeon]
MSTEEPEDDDDLTYFVRVGQTDLDGTASVERALTGLDGIGHRAARLITRQVGVDRRETFGRLDEDRIEEIVDAVEAFAENVPDWLTNRQKDFFTGEADHLIGNEVELVREQDVNRMQKIGSYKGVRHQRGQKVRGQRTKSTGRTEGTVGVNVEEIREEMEDEEAEESEEGEL